jgi:hypothetical protein
MTADSARQRRLDGVPSFGAGVALWAAANGDA